MNKPPNGSAVKYFHVIPQTKDHPAGIASYDAIVLGFESQPEDAKGLPAASLAFFNPAKSIHLSGAEWAHSFERVDSVPHADETRFHWYVTKDAVTGLPSEADLDAVAEEEEAKEATSGKGKSNGKKAKLIAGE